MSVSNITDIAEQDLDINVGDTVRSHDSGFFRDLEGGRAHFVEGTVVRFEKLEGCFRCVIKVERDVWAGEDTDRRIGSEVFPPVNGTKELMSGEFTDNVQFIKAG